MIYLTSTTLRHSSSTLILAKKFIHVFIRYTLPKCPGGHQILHRELKLNSKISAAKYEKK